MLFEYSILNLKRYLNAFQYFLERFLCTNRPVLQICTTVVSLIVMYMRIPTITCLNDLCKRNVVGTCLMRAETCRCTHAQLTVL